LLLAGVGCSQQLQPWEEMQQRYATTQAIITGTRCEDHHNVSYEFRVSGRIHVGKAYGIGRSCEAIRPGDLVLVYYHPGMPGINSTKTPEEAYEHHKAQAYMPLYFAAFIVLGLAISVFFSLRELSAQDALDSTKRRRGMPPS
jgi:hypothetical protein